MVMMKKYRKTMYLENQVLLKQKIIKPIKVLFKKNLKSSFHN